MTEDFDLQGSYLNLRRLLNMRRDSNIIVVSPADELSFAAAVEELVVVKFMARMLDNGFEFAWNGERIRIRVDPSYAQGYARCENLTVRNFNGVVASYFEPYGLVESPNLAPSPKAALETKFWYGTKCETCGKVNENAEDSSVGWKMYSRGSEGVGYTCPTCPLLPGAQNAFEH